MEYTVNLDHRNPIAAESMLQRHISDIQCSKVELADAPEKVRTLYLSSKAMFEGVRDQGLIISDDIQLQPKNVITHAGFLNVASYCRFGIAIFIEKISEHR